MNAQGNITWRALCGGKSANLNQELGKSLCQRIGDEFRSTYLSEEIPYSGPLLTPSECSDVFTGVGGCQFEETLTCPDSSEGRPKLLRVICRK